MGNTILHNALIFLGAALVFVPVAKKLGIGSVLGYIIGGVVIGPYVLGFIGGEGEDIMHATEFGVVMMLFLIGLELNPAAFWQMRNSILGLGGLQMLLTSILLFPVFYFVLSLSINASIALALSFAMSSTAIILQTLKEKSLDRSQAGRSSFAVLLFQDIAVIPILALLPIIAASNALVNNHHNNSHLGILSDYPSVTILLAVLFIFFSARFLINPFLRAVAKIHMRELFTAAALFIVIGVATLMELAGISAALGAFMAGVLLANSEYRHELESDIEPFKGVLLGLFFAAVGSTINFGLIVNQPLTILQVVVVVMIIKSFVLFTLAKVFRFDNRQSILFALLLSQVGEFAFVLLGSSAQLNLIDKTTSDFYMAVITISMIISPVLLFVIEKYIATRFKENNTQEEKEADAITEENQIIIAGFGHFGSTLGRFLRANGINATILDNDIDRVLLLRKMSFKVYFGDATRLDLLEAAGAAKAKILISAIDAPEKNFELTELLQKHFPQLKLFVRAKNRIDAYELMEKGLEHIHRESLHSSVYMGVDVLNELGHRKYTTQRKANEFIKYDQAALHKLVKERHDKENYVLSVKEEIEMQERLLNEDKKFIEHRQDNAWDKSLLIK
jgi:CPA2 family monovalent cation:H+ antiporter-2